MLDDALGRAAEKDMPQGGTAMSRHHDEIRPDSLGEPADFAINRDTFAEMNRARAGQAVAASQFLQVLGEGFLAVLLKGDGVFALRQHRAAKPDRILRVMDVGEMDGRASLLRQGLRRRDGFDRHRRKIDRD